MSSLVMVGRGLLPAILPCHAIQLGFAGGKARVPSKRAASESRRKAKRRRAAALQKGHLRSRPLHGSSIRQRWSSQFGVSNRKSAGKSAYATYLSMVIQLGFAEGKAGVPSKRAASESGRKAKRRRAAALQKGHLRKPPCMGAPFGSVGHRNLEYRIVRAQARVRTLLTFPWPFSWDFTNDSALSGCAEAVYRLGLAVGSWGNCNTKGTKGR